MLAKAYDELDEMDSLLSLLESFSKLLTRKKLMTARHQITHQNFLKYLKKLLKANKKNVPDLSKKLENQQIVAERIWLKEKVMELG